MRYKVNPVPRITVFSADTIYCDSSIIQFNISDNNGLTLGQKKMKLTSTFIPGAVSGVTPSGEFNRLTFNNTLINNSDSLQIIEYEIKARIKNPKEDDTLFYCDAGTDTIIRIYLNPLPKFKVTVQDTIFCDSSTVQFSITSLNGNILGQKYYELISVSDSVSGVHLSGNYPIAGFTDNIFNQTNHYEIITYTLRPGFRNPRTGLNYCNNGKDTIIHIYLNPYPVMNILYPDTIFCDSSLVNFTLNSLNGNILGQKYYLIHTLYDSINVSRIHQNGYFPISDFTDSMINRSDSLKKINYQFLPVFRNPLGTNNNPIAQL